MRKPNKYWTREKVFEASKQYSSRVEFLKGCSSAYKIACKNHWLDGMTWLSHRKHLKGLA